MRPDLPNICRDCPAWQVLESEMSHIANDRYRSAGEQRVHNGLNNTAVLINKRAGEINCRSIPKPEIIRPVGDLVLHSAEVREYASVCPVVADYTEQTKAAS